jgi:hypothetical protein
MGDLAKAGLEPSDPAIMEISDEELSAKGGIFRLIKGEIFIGKTQAELEAEENPKKIEAIQAQLDDIDKKSGRRSRAAAIALAAGKTPVKIDIDRLRELEDEAEALRKQLKDLTASAE